jgi:EpsI family protein
MFTMPVLFLEMWVLSKIGAPTPKEIVKAGEGSKIPQQNVGLANVSQPFLKGLLQPVFLFAIILMVGTLVSSQGIEFRDKVPIKKPLDQFPLAIGDWKGERQTMEQQFIDALHFSDYVMVDYRNPKGQNISFYVAYYESQRKGEATHSPETCLPGSGWVFEQSGLASVDTGKVKVMRVNKAFITKGDERQLVYFWFPQRGRILTSLYQVKLYSFWDALIKKRTDGALVRVITPLTGNESVEKAEERLIDFVKLVNPQLKQFIPQS